MKCACTFTYGHTYDSDACTFKSRGFITELDKTTKHTAEKKSNYTLCVNSKKYVKLLFLVKYKHF